MKHIYFAERFAAARGRKGLTLKDVAAACRVTPQAVKKWEDGTCYPSSGALLSFAALADCSVEWLMDFSPLDFHSTETAPQGRHAKYWVRAALEELWAIPDDLVARMRDWGDMITDEAADRIEALEEQLRDRRLERDHANLCADAAIDRAKELEAENARLRAAHLTIIQSAPTLQYAIQTSRDALYPKEGGE